VRLESVYVLELSTRALPAENSPNLNIVSPNIWACIFPEEQFPVAKQFWQHSGEGISSRRAEYCQSLFTAGLLLCKKNDYDANDGVCKGPRRYQKRRSTETAYSPIPSEKGMPFPESADFNSYVEERFGRNLNISLSFNAKVAIRRRIAGSMTTDVDIKQPLQVNTNGNITESNRGFSEDDVYLYPAGMNAIFNTHRTLLSVIGPHQSICYG
jgi:cystathionine gamma-synthase